jgi:hypothetical protein
MPHFSPPDRTRPLPAELQERLALQETFRHTPRMPALLASYLSRSKTPCSVSGAGSHTLALLQHGVKVQQAFDLFPGTADSYPIPVRPLDSWRPADGPLLLSHPEHEAGMAEALQKRGIPFQPLYGDRECATFCLAELAPTWRQQLQALPAKSPKRTRLVVVQAQARSLLSAQHWAQLADDFEVVPLHLLSRGEPESWPMPSLNARGSLSLLTEALHRLEPDLLMVVDHFAGGSLWPLLIGRLLPDTPLICLCYDLLSHTFDDPMLLAEQGLHTQSDVALALFSETSPWVDGFVLKDGCANRLPAPAHTFLPGLSSTTFHPIQLKARPERLVYAGSMAAENADPRLYGDNLLSPLFAELVELGFCLDLHSTQPSPILLKRLYPTLWCLARQGRLSLHTAVPQAQLLTSLSTAHAGLQIGRPHRETAQRVSHGVTVSTKLFSYLAAGLPLVVGSYLSHMAEWVSRYELGWVADAGNLADLPGLLQTRQASATGLEAFRRETCLEAQIQALAPFLRKVRQSRRTQR